MAFEFVDDFVGLGWVLVVEDVEGEVELCSGDCGEGFYFYVYFSLLLSPSFLSVVEPLPVLEPLSVMENLPSLGSPSLPECSLLDSLSFLEAPSFRVWAFWVQQRSIWFEWSRCCCLRLSGYCCLRLNGCYYFRWINRCCLRWTGRWWL